MSDDSDVFCSADEGSDRELPDPKPDTSQHTKDHIDTIVPSTDQLTKPVSENETSIKSPIQNSTETPRIQMHSYSVNNLPDKKPDTSQHTKYPIDTTVLDTDQTGKSVPERETCVKPIIQESAETSQTQIHPIDSERKVKKKKRKITQSIKKARKTTVPKASISDSIEHHENGQSKVDKNDHVAEDTSQSSNKFNKDETIQSLGKAKTSLELKENTDPYDDTITKSGKTDLKSRLPEKSTGSKPAQIEADSGGWDSSWGLDAEEEEEDVTVSNTRVDGSTRLSSKSDSLSKQHHLDQPSVNSTKVSISSTDHHISSKLNSVEKGKQSSDEFNKSVDQSNAPANHNQLMGSRQSELDDLVWPSDILSSASNMMRSHLGGFAQALKNALPTGTKDDDAEQRRRRRELEEFEERRLLSDAVSSAWESTWGDFDDDEMKGEDVIKSSEQMRDVGLERQSTSDNVKSNTGSSSFWDWTNVSSLAQQVTSTVQDKGRSFVEGGIGVLETIGAKTMSVLQENDPGFQYTKQLFRVAHLRDKPTLSQLIREGQKNLSATDSQPASFSDQSPTTTKSPSDFTSRLEQNRALVHLEAFELVGEQAEYQLHVRLDLLSSSSADTMVPNHLTSPGGLLDSIWSVLQPPGGEDEDDDLEETANQLTPDDLEEFKVGGDSRLCSIDYQQLEDDQEIEMWNSYEIILKFLGTIYSSKQLAKVEILTLNLSFPVQATVTSWQLSDSLEHESAQDWFDASQNSLADLTGASLAYLRKLSECILAGSRSRDFVKLAKAIAVLIRSIVRIETNLCSRFTKQIKSASSHGSSPTPSHSSSASQLVANLMLNCGNAQMYLNNCYRLLVPVIQLACVNSAADSSPSPPKV